MLKRDDGASIGSLSLCLLLVGVTLARGSFTIATAPVPLFLGLMLNLGCTGNCLEEEKGICLSFLPISLGLAPGVIGWGIG